MEIANLQQELNNLQSNTIGLFKPFRDTTTWLVTNNDRGHLHCISIGALGGLNRLSINKDQGKYVEFENRKTLAELMDSPYELNDVYHKFRK